jgi:hypothetical protein
MVRPRFRSSITGFLSQEIGPQATVCAVAAQDDRSGRGLDPARTDTRAPVLVVVEIAGMGFDGWPVVSGAERVVSSLGLCRSMVGLTFVALATPPSCSRWCGQPFGACRSCR